MKRKTYTNNFWRGRFLAVWLAGVLVMMGGVVFGQTSTTPFDIKLFSAQMPGDPNTARFDTDHNANFDLSAGYIAFEIWNTSGSDYIIGDLQAKIEIISVNVPTPDNTGAWSLGDQPASQYIYSPKLGKGQLENDEKVRVFWRIQYPTVTTQSAVNATATFRVTVFNLELAEDNMTLVEAPIISKDQPASTQDVQNTSSAALVASTTFDPGPEAFVGELIEFCVTYNLGGFPKESNNPNKETADLYVQPCVNSNFNAGSYQLVGTRVNSISANLVGIPNPAVDPSTDKLWFKGVTELNESTPNFIEVCYIFRVVEVSGPTPAYPHSSHRENASDVIKYDGGGTNVVFRTFPGPECPDITVTKVASPDFLTETDLQVPADRQVTYTVTITNNTKTTNNDPVPVSIDMIKDVIQVVNNVQLIYRGTGTGSDITNANSFTAPLWGGGYGGASQPLIWEAGIDANFPPPSPYSEYYVDGNGGQLDLIYILEFPGPPDDPLAPAGRWTNTVEVYVGGCPAYTATEFVTPIQLAYFRGQSVEDEIHLQWRTENEIDNDYMAVERSADGRSFAEIGRVTGQGNTYSEPQEYTFIDALPLPGVNYYRLRQVDFDGTTEYHPVIAVQYRGNAARTQVSVFPNPANDRLNVRWTTPDAGPVSLQLFDFTGRQLARYTTDPKSAGFELPVNNLPAGLYLLQVATGMGTETVRFKKK